MTDFTHIEYENPNTSADTNANVDTNGNVATNATVNDLFQKQMDTLQSNISKFSNIHIDENFKEHLFILQHAYTSLQTCNENLQTMIMGTNDDKSQLSKNLKNDFEQYLQFNIMKTCVFGQ